MLGPEQSQQNFGEGIQNGIDLHAASDRLDRQPTGRFSLYPRPTERGEHDRHNSPNGLDKGFGIFSGTQHPNQPDSEGKSLYSLF